MESSAPTGMTDRDQFLKAAVETLLIQIDDGVLCAIVEAGKPEFVRIAREKWQGHGFDTGDLGQAFEMIEDRYVNRPQLLIKG